MPPLDSVLLTANSVKRFSLFMWTVLQTGQPGAQVHNATQFLPQSSSATAVTRGQALYLNFFTSGGDIFDSMASWMVRTVLRRMLALSEFPRDRFPLDQFPPHTHQPVCSCV